MTIRRINFTGKRIIHAKHITLDVKRDSSNILGITVHPNLDSYEFPKSAKVFFEIQKQAMWKRFDLGTIDNLRKNEFYSIEEYETEVGLRCRLKVVESHKAKGRILGLASAVTITGSEEIRKQLKSLLSVSLTKRLKEGVFSLSFDSDRPLLLLNSELADKEYELNNPLFYPLVLPSALYQIYFQILIVDSSWDEDDDSSWQFKWMKFAREQLNFTEKPKREDKLECLGWIQYCVTIFSSKHKLMSKYVKARK